MLTGLIAAGIGAAAGFGSSAFSNYNNKKNQRRSYEYNIQSLRQSPQAVRQGLEDAGYNPLLAVSSAQSNGFSSSVPAASAADFTGSARQAAELANLVLARQELENDKTKAEINLLEKQADKTEVDKFANSSLHTAVASVKSLFDWHSKQDKSSAKSSDKPSVDWRALPLVLSAEDRARMEALAPSSSKSISVPRSPQRELAEDFNRYLNPSYKRISTEHKMKKYKRGARLGNVHLALPW